MNKLDLINALKVGNIEWRRHALERMLQRNISRSDVKETLKYGEIIEYYKMDKPFESALFFYHKEKVLHVVASFDKINKIIYIITAYIPDTKHFLEDLKTRRNNEKK